MHHHMGHARGHGSSPVMPSHPSLAAVGGGGAGGGCGGASSASHHDGDIFDLDDVASHVSSPEIAAIVEASQRS